MTGRPTRSGRAHPPSAHLFRPRLLDPWGTLITAEESWTTAAGGSTSPYGRLFELQNPTKAPAIFAPVGASSNDGAAFVHQNVIPRTSHEGIQFDKAGNMYFIDELNGETSTSTRQQPGSATFIREGRVLRRWPDLRLARW